MPGQKRAVGVSAIPRRLTLPSIPGQRILYTVHMEDGLCLACWAQFQFWAREHARKGGVETDLGLKEVEITWMGERGLKKNHSLPLLSYVSEYNHPHFMFIHCGGNDIGHLTGVTLEIDIKETFSTLMSMFLNTHFVFFNTYQRQKWKLSTLNAGRFEKTQRHANKAASVFVQDHGMSLIFHLNNKYSNALYRPDDVHFTTYGNHLLLANLKNWLQKHLNMFIWKNKQRLF